MLARFDLFVVLRNQVSDRAIVRRCLAVEAVMEELAAAAGEDATAWGLAGLGSGLGAQLSGHNPERAAQVTRELLTTEGAPAELAAAVHDALVAPADGLSRTAAALAGARALVAAVYADLDAGDATIDTLDARAIELRVARAARRGDPAATRAVAALAHAGLELARAAEATLAAMRRVREDLRL